jgi:hypothetical protein
MHRSGWTAALAFSGASLALSFLLAAITAAGPALAETEDGPRFRAGLWRFSRTIEYPDHRVVVRQEETTRCVDPTRAVNGTFNSPNIGGCRSDRPERVGNRYTMANRCDYLGPVRTDITVHSDEAYTENNWIKTSNFPQVDRVLAERVGDCDATSTHLKQNTGESSSSSEASARRKSESEIAVRKTNPR